MILGCLILIDAVNFKIKSCEPIQNYKITTTAIDGFGVFIDAEIYTSNSAYNKTMILVKNKSDFLINYNNYDFCILRNVFGFEQYYIK